MMLILQLFFFLKYSMQFMKYSLSSLEFINTKTHRESNERERKRERERNGSKAQREWHRDKF